MSFGRRLELVRRIREVSHKLEFARAGNTTKDTMDATLVDGEVDQICLEWGLVGVDGLEIDGKPATASNLLAEGPEALCREIIDAVKHECGLTEQERKN
jgi:hypothetical protein